MRGEDRTGQDRKRAHTTPSLAPPPTYTDTYLSNVLLYYAMNAVSSRDDELSVTISYNILPILL
jgi:hypothetical protein